MSSIIKVDTIQLADGTAGTIENLGLATGALSHRNLIINGAMQVNQRGDATSQTGGGYKACDRYSIRQVNGYLNGLTFDATQQTTSPPNGFKYYYQLKTLAGDTPSSTDTGSIRYIVEDEDIEHLGFGTSGAKAFTLSFWVKASVSGTYTVGFISGNRDYSYVAEYTISSADTWEYVSISVTAPTSGIWSSSGRGIEIHWNVAGASGSSYSTTAGSWVSGEKRYSNNQVNNTATANNTFNLTGVQLEVGSVATPFEHRSYGEELARCQRYYQRFGQDGDAQVLPFSGQCTSSSTVYFMGQTYVPMRTQPSGSSTNPSNFRVRNAGNSGIPSISSLNINPYSETSFAAVAENASGLTAGHSSALFNYNGSNYGWIELDAEL